MLAGFEARLVQAWGSWAPTLSPDGRRVAFISDRRGRPELWVLTIAANEPPSQPSVVSFAGDPVVSVSWSGDGQWLACAVAVDGGVRTQCWALRPDGTDAHPLNKNPTRHVTLGPWTRRGYRVVIMSPPRTPDDESVCDLVDPDPSSGTREPLAHGGLVNVLSLSVDERFALLRDGTRGAHFCVTLDRELDRDHPLLPYPGTGSTEHGLLRPAPGSAGLTAYLVTDAGRPRYALAAVPVGPEGLRGDVGIVAEREDGELEHFDADDDGRRLLLVWNVGGRSVVELLDPASGTRTAVDSLPGAVVTGCVLARDGRSAVLSIEAADTPQQLWRLDCERLNWRQLTFSPLADLTGLIEPELVEFVAHDGLPLTGWLYRATGAAGPGPAVISLHGGPESQERPGFQPNHQAVAAAGITVFAPNVRGSAGFGRQFAHIDDRYGRYDAIDDVRSCADYLVDSAIADPTRLAVAGRSYGGYLTLAALTRYPGRFAAGVDICGMSDLLTFFRDTEPWIANAAVTKYGDPDRDRALLIDLSPLHRAEVIRVPLLVVHGEHDTNVPIGEAHQIVAAVRANGGTVSYLELPGEGHEYRSQAARLQLLERLVDFLANTLQSSRLRQDVSL